MCARSQRVVALDDVQVRLTTVRDPEILWTIQQNSLDGRSSVIRSRAKELRVGMKDVVMEFPLSQFAR